MAVAASETLRLVVAMVVTDDDEEDLPTAAAAVHVVTTTTAYVALDLAFAVETTTFPNLRASTIHSIVDGRKVQLEEVAIDVWVAVVNGQADANLGVGRVAHDVAASEAVNVGKVAMVQLPVAVETAPSHAVDALGRAVAWEVKPVALEVGHNQTGGLGGVVALAVVAVGEVAHPAGTLL
ncbi:hypothetical protein FIBSPDRAFT_958052 [Athelia psychrophila]|uniref:Uncharacterized protein n=1 Tax=Athelia psychrophila TaxID=1759441 RepID=A0A166F104_9AGAM|nr:hypothetical protein FIBSPDRAFT_958052 [Fibularhizoctonia sp. CBS 109695]